MGRRQGLQAMDDSLADLARRGVCTPEAVLKRAAHPEEVARQLGVTLDPVTGLPVAPGGPPVGGSGQPPPPPPPPPPPRR